MQEDTGRKSGEKCPARQKREREDTGKRRSAALNRSYYEGNFYKERDFRLCRHQPYEIKGMSVGLYFQGHLEETEEGCRITGRFRKKGSANLFLILGLVLCLIALPKAWMGGQHMVAALSLGLFGVFLYCFLVKSKKGCRMLLRQLERISEDEAYRGAGKSEKSSIKRNRKN